MPKIAVVGGGAAGLMAAIWAGRGGSETHLYEKNEKTGKKIYITGKGRCNFTNLCDRETFLSKVPRNPRFLYSALHFLSPEQMIAFIEDQGCPAKVERGQRAFPVSDKASDITKALMRAAAKAGVVIHTGAQAASLVLDETGDIKRVSGLRLTGGDIIPADAVILATGGLSYPSTGSTGDGYAFSKALGHTITPLSPSLTGLDTEEDWPRELQGLSLKNVRLTLKKAGREKFSGLGEMLFTHYGISGPLVLEVSSLISGSDLTDALLVLDMKPALTAEQLEKKYLEAARVQGKKTVRGYLETLLPRRMAQTACRLHGVDEACRLIDLNAPSRRSLCEGLKAFTLTPVQLRPFTEAIITRGGVDLSQVEPGTMRSKLVPNLYFAGEILDVDAMTGGFNLHIAFSTGALAGHSAAKQLTTSLQREK